MVYNSQKSTITGMIVFHNSAKKYDTVPYPVPNVLNILPLSRLRFEGVERAVFRRAGCRPLLLLPAIPGQMVKCAQQILLTVL